MFYVMNETSIYCPIIVLKWSVSDEITIIHINFDIKNSNLLNGSPAIKMIYELMIKKILMHNSDVEIGKRHYIDKNGKSKLDYETGSVYFYPGFTTSISCPINHYWNGQQCVPFPF